MPTTVRTPIDGKDTVIERLSTEMLTRQNSLHLLEVRDNPKLEQFLAARARVVDGIDLRQETSDIITSLTSD
ncbi:hypothetical protein HCB17_06795 [Salinispora arenicola]|uniref:hypothetical protein n=1 Tax=Salinispora arenicola TaxID=168697 RepID=UPI0014313607|nr:hypothetical protein [Salinispora arenicola]NIL40911.1 hypothetical protein [Salinispora arenicola]NIL60037.1 hypothetical protein [Salinispora arenicola]